MHVSSAYQCYLTLLTVRLYVDDSVLHGGLGDAQVLMFIGIEVDMSKDVPQHHTWCRAGVHLHHALISLLHIVHAWHRPYISYRGDV